MRTIHRLIAPFVVLVLLFLGVTGTLIQSIDLRTLLRHAPPDDPDMMAIREDKDGSDDYAVLATPDYTAAALPNGFDFAAAFPRLLAATQSATGIGALDYVEVRMEAGGPTGVALSGHRLLYDDFGRSTARIDSLSGHERGPPSLRNEVKGIHRMTTFGDWALWINPVVGVCLGVFIVTGMWLYFQMLSARRRIKRRGWFWKGGGWWRVLHRWTSLVAALFLVVITLTGVWLAYESLYFGLWMEHHRPAPGGSVVARQSGVQPLSAAQIPGMLTRTLQSYSAEFAGQPIKVLRLRVYGGMPQGVLVVGQGDDTQQVVFNTNTGRRASETEPGYPDTGFPFGWQAHQWAKQIHRGSIIGLSGRWMDLIGGVALIYLSMSGVVMYFDLWNRRRKSGRPSLLWTS